MSDRERYSDRKSDSCKSIKFAIDLLRRGQRLLELRYPEMDDGFDDWKDSAELFLSNKSKPITVEEMNERWGDCPPFECREVVFRNTLSHSYQRFELNQDTIKEIREYLDAVGECMNS